MNTIKALCQGTMALVASAVLAEAASAQSFTPEASAVVNGSYTVSYVPNCGELIPPGYFCAFAYLMEKPEPSGAWTPVSSDTGSISFTSKPAGSYSYRIWAAGGDPFYNYFETESPAITVVVSYAPPPPPPPASLREDILTQLNYQYSVRRGDINGDGRTDLFVKKTAGGGPLNGVIEEVILRQATSGQTFVPIVPTAAQAAVASAWPLAPGVSTRLHDIDVDGYVDVTLSNVASAVSGARDQIVYSPGQPTVAQPGGIRAVDANLAKFVGNAMDYFYDPDYFVNNAPLYYYEISSWYVYCPLWWGGSGLDTYGWQFFDYCIVDSYYYSGLFADYSGFSEAALALWSNEFSGENGYLSEEQAMAAIESTIEGVIQAPIGGWPMEELLGQIGPHSESLFRRGLEAFQSILAASRAIPEHVDMDKLPPQTPRARDVIHVTGHELLFDRGHVALEYTNPLAGGVGTVAPVTLSGAAERWPATICWPGMIPPQCGFGKLLAETNKLSDQWFLNFTVGSLLPFTGSANSYWHNQLSPRHNRYANLPYGSKLNYNWLPDLISNTYNSNGYVRGLNGTGGFFVVPYGMDSVYPGWNRPVPDEKFR